MLRLGINGTNVHAKDIEFVSGEILFRIIIIAVTAISKEEKMD